MKVKLLPGPGRRENAPADPQCRWAAERTCQPPTLRGAIGGGAEDRLREGCLGAETGDGLWRRRIEQGANGSPFLSKAVLQTVEEVFPPAGKDLTNRLLRKEVNGGCHGQTCLAQAQFSPLSVHMPTQAWACAPASVGMAPDSSQQEELFPAAFRSLPILRADCGPRSAGEPDAEGQACQIDGRFKRIHS